jgi:hypothetical protein
MIRVWVEKVKRVCIYCTYAELVNDWVSGVFGNLRKAAVSFIMFVCLSAYPSIRMEQLHYPGRIFMKVDIWVFLCLSIKLKFY